jgi:hypothetical protein
MIAAIVREEERCMRKRPHSACYYATRADGVPISLFPKIHQGQPVKRDGLDAYSSTASRTSCSDDGSELLTRSIRSLTFQLIEHVRFSPSGLYRKCGRSDSSAARHSGSVVDGLTHRALLMDLRPQPVAE